MTRSQSAVMRAAVARFAPSAKAVPLVRASTVRTLTAWSVSGDAVAVAETIVCELVTNAVQASRPEDDFIAVRLSASNGSVVVEVWSRNDTTEPRVMDPGVDSETGRGLALVEALSSRWDAYRAKSGGVVVWAQFPAAILPAPRASDVTAPMPRREPRAVDQSTAPPDSSTVYSTDPDVLARVADRLRALHPWHESPATHDPSGALALAASAPDSLKERT